MTSFATASDGNLTKTELTALLVEDSTQTVYTVPEDVYAKTTFDGASGFEGGRRLLFRAGQEVTQAQVDALFLAATIDTVTPATGPAAGGTNITITGTNFGGASGATVGGTPVTNFVVVSNKKITCTTPAKTAGAYAVAISDNSGTVTKNNAFTTT